jgi:predicted TIM-barrel fold metal-dependent hydrolase
MKGLKIDAFCHVMPAKFKDRLFGAVREKVFLQRNVESQQTLWDMDRRRQIMDRHDGLVQIICLAAPPIEQIVSNKKKAAALARFANDEMAELVYRYPDYFVAAVACLPINHIDTALDEIDRAIRDLKFRGVLMHTPVNDKPLDLAEFEPIYQKMSEYDLPILVHPLRSPEFADYRTESRSKFRIAQTIGWPYETACMMLRLTFSGVLQKHPNLKLLAHHGGGFIPFLEKRIVGGYDSAEMRRQEPHKLGLTRPPIEYLKRFYFDTALHGHVPALMCTYAFCGAEKMLFATDSPYDSQLGDRYARENINAVEQMEISEVEKKMIFEDNARKLFQLPV